MATSKQESAVGESRTERTERIARTGPTERIDAETRKQQIARRLKLSERVLEQYFQSKQAEAEDEQEITVVPERQKRAGIREKRI